LSVIVLQLLKRMQKGHVDILERLPTPFGSVRSGVSPDHPEIKVSIYSPNNPCFGPACAAAE
jgi:NADPH-dependent glutamate synthase beta subunit-like oxidoreductase